MSDATAPVVDAEVFLKCQNMLGEGIIWDSKEQLIHWVDINTAEIHTLDPESMKYSVDSYPETEFVTALALRKDEPGFIGLAAHEFVLFPAPTTPTSTNTSPRRVPRKILKTLSSPVPSDKEYREMTRMNDGGTDPSGRFLGGNMTKPDVKDGKKRGELWRYDPDGKETQIMTEIGTSNGIGWSPNEKLMCLDYIDSGAGEVSVWDYDNSTGTPSNRRTFVTPPPPMSAGYSTSGVFDGLIVDGVGNVWVARWKESRVVGYRPDGSLICQIRLSGCKSPTIPCFGGKDLSTMYIATANSELAGDGDGQAEFPYSGDVFKLDFGKGSEVRKLLGEGWKGRERYRFAG